MIPDWARPHLLESLAGGSVLCLVVLGAWAVL